MINIILDTNILHKEGLSSGRMQVMKKLVSDELITIHVSEIVQKEFITKRISEITNALNSIQGSLRKSQGKLDHENELKTRSAALVSEVAELKGLVEKNVNDDFEAWVESHKVNVIKFNPEYIEQVLHDYFSGSGAFKAQKSREDFPDSMIHQTICGLVKDVGEVHAILIDGAFKKGMEKQKGITILDSINDLLNLEDIKRHLSSEELNTFFVSKELSVAIATYLTTQPEMIRHIYIPDGGVENTELIGIRVFGAEINGPDEETINNLCIDNFYAISSNEFTADISFFSDTSVHYISDYGSYLELERDGTRLVDMDSMNGEGICDLYESFVVKFSGKISVTFFEENSVESIKEMMSNLIDNEDGISIELDIDMASLIDIRA